FAVRSVRFADGEPGSLDVPDDAGLDDLRRAVDDAADVVLGPDRRADRRAGVDALQHRSAWGCRQRLEIPPGDAVLGPDRRRVRREQLAELTRDLRQAVCLERDED